MTRVVLVLGVLSVLSLPDAAAAQGGYVGVGLGPAVRMEDWPTQLRVEQEIGYFVNGEPTGFYVAFAPSQSWGNDWWTLVFPVRLGGVGTLYRNRDISFALGGTGTLGFALTDQFNNGRDPDAWFHFSVALLARLMIGRQIAFYLRPLGFEFAFGDSRCCGSEAIRYVLAGGFQYFFF